MKSVVDLDVRVPQAALAELFADPRNNAKWMQDIERCEQLSGPPGMPGSTYRMVPKKGSMVFVATVLERHLPFHLHLKLNSASVVVEIIDTFRALSVEATHLRSVEVFHFKGAIHAVLGFFASPLIRRAHRRHMRAFREFAESQSVRAQERAGPSPGDWGSATAHEPV